MYCCVKSTYKRVSEIRYLREKSSIEKKHQWQIGDLGLSHANYTSSNNEIYGVIPFIAPEIFRGSRFSKESDVCYIWV
ncbi:hypothetical protein RhiirC2_795878 [Rhizophagus irregularis]|uniref:Protein kinase domain-containing protein n=1 Tax=Rhizophagus irregularis TaxID=588596 RepID=A0A2N1MAS7_9GLOM|nr:hypothetical protein RhiirC2_795878 [Rhizophagus irregularis]